MIKAETTIEHLIELVNKADKNPAIMKSLITAITKTIPTVKHRRPIMLDKNINKLFNVRRIGYNAVVKIQAADETGMYTADVVKILSGETKVTEGTSLSISKRELQLIGRPYSI